MEYDTKIKTKGVLAFDLPFCFISLLNKIPSLTLSHHVHLMRAECVG